MNELRELILRRDEVRSELQSLNHELIEVEESVKKNLIDHEGYECLSVNWKRVRCLCGN